MQINHPGRQVFASNNRDAIAPSAVPVAIEGYAHLFAQPRAMTDADIAEVIRRFADTAVLAEVVGFDGVQVHAAHGYLLSQFLLPLTNLRTDQWGGSVEKRARILIEIIRAVRARVAPGFGVGVKLNSSDFQKGRFDAQDAVAVVRMLNDLPVDLVELSGGRYESPVMHGRPAQASTAVREAYFVDFARDIVVVARMPVMVTGGIRRRATAEAALAPEGDRPRCRHGWSCAGTGLCARYAEPLAGERGGGGYVGAALEEPGAFRPCHHGDDQAATAPDGRGPQPPAWVPWALLRDRLRMARGSRRYRAWLQHRPAA